MQISYFCCKDKKFFLKKKLIGILKMSFLNKSIWNCHCNMKIEVGVENIAYTVRIFKSSYLS